MSKFKINDIVIFCFESKYYIGVILKDLIDECYYIHSNEMIEEVESKDVEIHESQIILFNHKEFVIKRKVVTITYSDELIDFK
jgi:hypothetical protein